MSNLVFHSKRFKEKEEARKKMAQALPSFSTEQVQMKVMYRGEPCLASFMPRTEDFMFFEKGKIVGYRLVSLSNIQTGAFQMDISFEEQQALEGKAKESFPREK